MVYPCFLPPWTDCAGRLDGRSTRGRAPSGPRLVGQPMLQSPQAQTMSWSDKWSSSQRRVLALGGNSPLSKPVMVACLLVSLATLLYTCTENGPSGPWLTPEHSVPTLLIVDMHVEMLEIDGLQSVGSSA